MKESNENLGVGWQKGPYFPWEVWVAKKVQEERRKADEKAEREAIIAEEETMRKLEADEKRSTNLVRLAEASNKAREYREKVKELADKAKRDMELSKDYEKEIEDPAQHGDGSRKRQP